MDSHDHIVWHKGAVRCIRCAGWLVFGDGLTLAASMEKMREFAEKHGACRAPMQVTGISRDDDGKPTRIYIGALE